MLVSDLNDFAENVISPSLSTLNGVGQVAVIGARKFAVRIEVDPKKLAARNMTLDDLAKAISTTTLPGPIAADACAEYLAHFGQRKPLALFGNPGVFHRTFLAKHAVAFFRISFSRLSRRFSARNRDSSISSGLTTRLPAPLSLPSAAVLTQLRTVWSLSPSSLQTRLTRWPSFIHLTASSLNSVVYACFGLFISCLPKSDSILCHLWQTIFRGKLSRSSRSLILWLLGLVTP